MNAQPPQQPERRRPYPIRAVARVWCVIAGVILGGTALISGVLGAVSGQQAVALELAGALVIAGGLATAAAADMATAWRLGFHTGRLLSRLRSLFQQNRP
jgi:hypothetical protein